MGFGEWVNRVFIPVNALDYMDLGSRDGENALMFQFFQWDVKGTSEETWWQSFANNVPRMASFGVTQVWLPPPNKAMAMDGRGYDAYDLWDLGEFNQKGGVATRWGTKTELLDAIDVAKRHGVHVLIDAVLNHKMGADRTQSVTAIPVDPNDRNRAVGAERSVEVWTKYDFPGRRGTYSAFTWSAEHFTGIDWDNRAKEKAIFKITQDRRRGWNKHVSKENGNYDYLLGADIDHLHPQVRDDLKRWGAWVLNSTGGAGFRLDAVKHFDHRFLSEFVQVTRNQPGRDRMFAVAEFWSPDARELDRYSRRLNTPVAVFDTPLHYNFHNASLDTSYDLRGILRGSLVEIRPKDSVTFVENHDTVVGQSLESPVAIDFKPIAYALILLRPHGHPCVYHADVYGPTVVPDLPRLMLARKRFAYGPCEDIIASSGDPNVIAFIRRGSEERQGCVVVLCNTQKTPFTRTIQLNLGKRFANTVWYDFLERGPVVQLTLAGKGSFGAAASVCVYIRKDGTTP